jgi:hypothetical protein
MFFFVALLNQRAIVKIMKRNAIKTSFEVKPVTGGRMERRSVKVDANVIAIDRVHTESPGRVMSDAWRLHRNGHEYGEFKTEKELINAIRVCQLAPHKAAPSIAQALLRCQGLEAGCGCYWCLTNPRRAA